MPDGIAGLPSTPVEAAPAACPANGAPVAVLRLDLTDFRSYASARLEVDARAVVLTGPNGAGKTNLLEAVSFLAPGRGLRRARLAEIDRRPELTGGEPDGEDPGGAHPWAVAARLATPDGLVAIGTGRDGSSESGDRRLVRVDGQALKGQAGLAGYLNLVWLTPQMDRLFQEGASPRRRFLDRLVFGYHPDHAERLAAYERALRERAKLLRAGGADPQWLAVLEETLAREGVAIAAARREITERLDAAAARPATMRPATVGQPGAFPAPRLGLDGGIEGWLDEMPALAVEDRLKAELAAHRRLDAEIGGAAVGPHRTDLKVRHAAKGAIAAECSTGEQKALLIAIVLAHARLQTGAKGTAPVLLLDEVAAHLDRTRRRALFDEIEALGSQAWLTGTDRELFAELGGRADFLTVADGMIQHDAPHA
ncbi:DNA replication and repair protein RecF [Aliidongia dinghuensis]|uniref:DNA replication and repair protein RecF n=1 Tax=Aliidongia dinghuensis TaxID=1867774 RepID=A0A8J2YXS5_9PROT|nr:DNA replication/repair protein RecF [Aliidongia dinghuensis]GGF37868.1 DNA replication and repair protein RecF [Aliidongia dinghuensis]